MCVQLRNLYQLYSSSNTPYQVLTVLMPFQRFHLNIQRYYIGFLKGSLY